MPTFYRITKTIYHSLIPERVRGPLHNEHTLLGRTCLSILRWLESMGHDDEIYDEDYYKRLVDPAASHAAPVIAASVVEAFHPASIVDVGCGSGAILKAFTALGVKAFGVDNSQASLGVCRSRGLEVAQFDLESPIPFPHISDVVISTEVAEHLPATHADAYVALLTSIAPTVVITAAPPGQGGTDHVNEQPYSYWIEKFQSHGCRYLEEQTMNLRARWKDRGVNKCYSANLLLFSRTNDPAN
jgi:SAM-dependent methyltransferase